MRIFISVACFTCLSSMAFASGPDNSIWVAFSKSCNSQTQPVLGEEKLQFGSGMLAHIYLLSQNSAQICNQAQVFSRVTEASGEDATSYLETASLSAQQQRTVCKSKANGNTISDTTAPFSAPVQKMSITLDKVNQVLTADIYGSATCTGGALRLVLRPKK